MAAITTTGRVPALTLGWRLRMAAQGIALGDLARELDVTPRTVTRWLTDQTHPRRPDLIRWAAVTGVDLDWLSTGRTRAGLTYSHAA